MNLVLVREMEGAALSLLLLLPLPPSPAPFLPPPSPPPPPPPPLPSPTLPHTQTSHWLLVREGEVLPLLSPSSHPPTHTNFSLLPPAFPEETEEAKQHINNIQNPDLPPTLGRGRGRGQTKNKFQTAACSPQCTHRCFPLVSPARVFFWHSDPDSDAPFTFNTCHQRDCFQYVPPDTDAPLLLLCRWGESVYACASRP